MSAYKYKIGDILEYNYWGNHIILEVTGYREKEGEEFGYFYTTLQAVTLIDYFVVGKSSCFTANSLISVKAKIITSNNKRVRKIIG